MFVYYKIEQAVNPTYRGPDFFAVLNVDGSYRREAWVVWLEEGRYPDIIIELLSSSTAEVDRTVKKELYEQVFHTANYFLYDPEQQTLIGWEMEHDSYVAIQPNPEGRLWSSQLGLWLGTWRGDYLNQQDVWLRFFDAAGNLVRIRGEIGEARAERAEIRAEQAEMRAEQAEAEAERLRALMRAAGQDPDAKG
jgi:hypothetical protein